MATLSLTIVKAKVLKDGTHKIRIAVRHKHETCYIITRFIVKENQFRNGQVVRTPDAATVNARLRDMLDTYQERLDKINNKEIYTCRQLKSILQNAISSHEDATFQAVCRKYIAELEEEGRDNYAVLLERNCRYFTEYTRGDILLSDITPVLIEGYARHLRVKRGLSDTSVGMMMSRTRTIINRGVKRMLVKYDVHPFLNYSIPAGNVRDVDLPVDVLNKIRQSDPMKKRLRIARDLFCLSFYLGGINLVDLMQLRFKGVTVLEYVRTKSRNTTHGTRTISFSIPPQARKIIDRWINRNTGRLDFGYKLSYPNFSRYVTRSLDSLARQLGIREKVVYYSARKSFAQYASEIGIPDGVIDYCLGHSDKSRGVLRFYTRVRQRQADAAIARVIDYADHPDKYQDYIDMRTDALMMRL